MRQAIGRRVSLLLVLVLFACREARQDNSSAVVDDRRPDATSSAVIDTGAGPAVVVRRYYDAIQNRHYDGAYALWENSGESSGQSRAEFAAGFAQTEKTSVAIGDSVSLEGAAGSQYATVPVTVDAALRDGKRQRFAGTYVLRRAMVDGATAEQRQWHIYSARLRLLSSR